MFGPGVLFVPVEPGSKKPVVAYAEREDAEFASEAWVTLLGMSSIAVLCGQRSGGVVCLDFDEESRGAEFDLANPALMGTLRVVGRRGWKIFLRVTGDWPRGSEKTPECEWRADGNLALVSGKHSEGIVYRRTVDAAPVTIEWTGIHWPEGWKIPGRAGDSVFAAIEDKQGPPMFLDCKGKPSRINEQFWAAALLSRERIVFATDEQRFYRYEATTGVWELLPEPVLRRMVADALMEWSRKNGEGLLVAARQPARVTGVVDCVRDQAAKGDCFAERPEAVHLTNGMLLWRGDKFVLEPFSPDFWSRNRCPVAFVEGAGCPRFLGELLGPVLRGPDVVLLQQFAGMFLCGRNILQRILILEGRAETGKSQVGLVLQKLVGEYNCTNLYTDLLEDKFEREAFLGKSLLVGSDVSETFFSAKSFPMLKGLTGEDLVSVQLKGIGARVTVRGQFNLLVTSNCRLRLRLQDDSEAWRRRLTVLRFEGEPPKKVIRSFGDLLIGEEGPGILNWALAGLAALYADLDAHGGRLVMDETQKKWVNQMLEESESLGIFVKERVRWDDEGDVTTSELLDAYCEWCGERGFPPLPMTVCQRMLGDLMMTHHRVCESHSVERDGRSKRGYRNVAVAGSREAETLPAPGGVGAGSEAETVAY